MAVLRNTLREKLDAGKPTIGTHFLLNDPDIPEIIGDTGMFDYAEYVAEYSSFDHQLLYHMARAGQCGNLPLMIKLDQANQEFWAQAALGAGFRAVLFTDIRSPEDVDTVHRAVKLDMPDIGGHMGVKTRRPSFGGYGGSEYLEDVKSIVTVIMIEKNAAVENIDAVLSRAREKGIDMTQWGPADFSVSLGKPDIRGTDELKAYEETVIAKSIEHGVAPRIEIGAVDQAQRYIDLGVKHFCIGWDRNIMQASMANLGQGMKELVASL